MGLKKLVICTENDEVLFSGTSQSVAPSASGTFATEGQAAASEERLTVPAPPPPIVEDEGDAATYCDDPPTILRAPAPRRSA